MLIIVGHSIRLVVDVHLHFDFSSFQLFCWTHSPQALLTKGCPNEWELFYLAKTPVTAAPEVWRLCLVMCYHGEPGLSTDTESHYLQSHILFWMFTVFISNLLGSENRRTDTISWKAKYGEEILQLRLPWSGSVYNWRRWANMATGRRLHIPSFRPLRQLWEGQSAKGAGSSRVGSWEAAWL